MRGVERLLLIVVDLAEHAVIAHVMPVDQRVRVRKIREVAVVDEQRAAGVLFPVEQGAQVPAVVLAMDDRVVDLRARRVQPAGIIPVHRGERLVIDLRHPRAAELPGHLQAALSVRRAQRAQHQQTGAPLVVVLQGSKGVLERQSRRLGLGQRGLILRCGRLLLHVLRQERLHEPGPHRRPIGRQLRVARIARLRCQLRPGHLLRLQRRPRRRGKQLIHKRMQLLPGEQRLLLRQCARAHEQAQRQKQGQSFHAQSPPVRREPRRLS